MIWTHIGKLQKSKVCKFNLSATEVTQTMINVSIKNYKNYILRDNNTMVCDMDLIWTFWTLEMKMRLYGVWYWFDVELLDSGYTGCDIYNYRF
jgi:hypothetical protein